MKFSAALCLLFFALISLPTGAKAGLRSRELPTRDGNVSAALAARAGASPADRIHVIVEVAHGNRRLASRDGVELLRSLDGNLWLASVPAAGLAARKLPVGVSDVWELLPDDRHPVRFADVVTRAARDGERLDVRVKWFRDASIDALVDYLDAEGARTIRRSDKLGFLDTRLPAEAVPSLFDLDAVRWVEAAPRDPVSLLAELRWDAEIDEVHTAGLSGSGVLVGMWDVGLPDTTHPDVTGRVIGGEAGLNLSLHAAHVAGIVIGDGTNSLNQGGDSLQWRGVAPAAELVAYHVFDAVLEVDTALVNYDIDLATNSWGYPVDSTNCDRYGDYGSDAPEYDQVVTGIYGKPLPVIFAAGNERSDLDCNIPENGGYGTILTPGTAKNVITVGAHYSDLLHMTPFSSWGPTDDGRMKPDISAPGCQTAGDLGITSLSINGGYIPRCGTSMAAPAVSGAVALLIEAWRAIYPGDPRPATHKALLGGFAKDRAQDGPDYRFGLGALNLEASMVALQTATTIEDAISHGGGDIWNFTVPFGVDTLVVTLAWDDAAGAELADTALVNDLDLQLLDPTFGLHQAFVLDPANPSDLAVPGSNRLDNVEQVRVLSPTAGTWKAIVLGFNVPEGPQKYSLVGFDVRPPADPALATAVAVDDTTAELSYIRAGDVDQTGTLVVRSLGPVGWVPTNGKTYLVGVEPAPGVKVIISDDADYSATPFSDDTLSPSTSYYYKFFSLDEIPNYSVGVTEVATPFNGVDAPLTAAAVARPALNLVGRHPVRGRADFRMELPRTAIVHVDVFDVIGRRVASVLRGERAAGSHIITWDGRDLSGQAVGSGIYFVRFRTEGVVQNQRLVLVR